jgi:hypothetical protein
MYVDIGERSLIVRFRYMQHDGRDVYTVCLIEDDSETICGLAMCNPSDRFSKPTGRRLALARAIKGLKSIEPGSRWYIWLVYALYHNDGCKAELAKALRSSKIDKVVRWAIWVIYFARHPEDK